MNNKHKEKLFEINEKKKDEALSLFSTMTEWKKYDGYKVTYYDDSPVIVPIDKSSGYAYNPFDFYPQILLDFIDLVNNVNQIIEDYECNKTHDEKHLLTLIAKRTIKFNNEYGLFNYEYGLYNNLTNINNDISMQSYAKAASAVMNDCDIVSKLKCEFVSYSTNFYYQDKYFSEKHSPFDSISENVDLTWEQFFRGIFMVQDISLTVDISSGFPQFSWVYNSLFKALNIMAIQSLVMDKNSIKFCKLDTCKRPFIMTRKDKEYCSNSCNNTDRQRRFIKNKKLKGNNEKKDSLK